MEQVKQSIRENAMLFIGIDMHQLKWQITIRDEAKVLWRGSIPGRWEELKKLLDRYRGYRMRAVYEAGCFGFWLHDNLKEYGVECIVTPPSFNLLLDEYELLTELIRQQTKLITEMAELPQYREWVKILTSTRGVGVLTAMEMILELQDVSRFPNGDHLAAYVGLTPSQHSTGDHVRMGHITGIGKPHLRGTIIEISWTLIRYYPNEREFYLKLKARAGSKRAIVAVARRFIIKARYMLLTNTPYCMRVAG